MAAKKKYAAVALKSFDDLDAAGIGAGYAPSFTPETPAPETVIQERGFTRTLGDYGLSLLKGAVSVPEAAVGLVDIPTGGRVGKALEEVGFRPKDAKSFLDEGYSDQQKQAFQAVQQAEGFGGKFVAALQNPSVVAHTVAESLPSMGAGGVVGRGVMALAPRLGAAGAAAIGEGVVGAGGAAEQIRQATPGGTMDAQQSGLAALSGAGTAAFSVLGGRVARALGLNDIDTMLVGAAANPVAAKGVVRRVLEGAVSEGVLEELPQSVQEQVLQNAALGKDLSEGVDQAAVLGLLSGAAMGGGANVLQGSPGHGQPSAPGLQQPEATPVAPAPPSGPITRALSDATERVASTPGPTAKPQPLVPEEVRAFNNAYRRPVEDPLGELQQSVRARTAYTSPEVTQAARTAVEDAWLRDKVQEGGEAVPPAAAEAPAAGVPAEDPGASMAEAVAHTDTKVRDGRILSALQNLVDQRPNNTAEALLSVGASLERAGMPALSAAEKERVTRLLGSHAAFTGKSEPAPLPNLPEPVVDAGADNAQLEALVPARAPKPPPAPRAAPAPQPTFATYEEADTYRREQRQRGASVQGLPIQTPDGGFGLAMRGTPEYAQAEALRDERRVAKERADAGIEDGDILNRLGKPFTVRYAANKAAEKAGAGHDVVPVKGGFVVRAAPVQAGPEMAGRDLGDGWVEFHKDSGTLGIPRAGMPQIKAEHRGAMVNFMNARGVAHQEETLQARDLKPTQAEFSRERVEKAKAFEGGNRSILVSRDGHVLDGHHQWLAAHDAGDEVKVIRLDAPIADLVKLAHEFPSSTAGEGATAGVAVEPSTTEESAKAAPETVAASADEEGAGAASIASEEPGQQQDPVAQPGPREETGGNQPLTVEQKAPEAIKSGAASSPADPRPVRGAGPRSTAKIEDFGETLHGARKMLYAEAYADGMAKAKELDIKANPLSKTWPEPDYGKLLEGGTPPAAVAMARALRDAVPTKPQSSWKLKGWSSKVETLRAFADDLVRGTMTAAAVAEAMERSNLGNVANQAALYEAMGHERSMKGIELAGHQYGMYAGVSYNPPRTIWTVSREAKGAAFGNWPSELAKGDTREEAVAVFKQRAAELLAQEQAPTKGATFEIYSKRAGGAREFFIGKKIGRNVAELKAGFADLKAARAYKAEHQAELEALLAKHKAAPLVRNTQNAPRIGEDYRKGADVTPVQFQESFGFRGVQFGNYVEGGRRQQDLNRAYDALMDLAGVLDLPPRALSLGGRLGLAFGARGTGGTDAAAAHYERGNVVINLTKREGAGSLAHEWWHGLDNYFSRQRGDGGGYMTQGEQGGDGVREEMRAAFREVMSAINRTGIQERSRKLDDRRSKEYWTTKPEMSARAFESYVISKLQDQNAGNDYLANVVADSVFALEGAYPYPTAGEMPVIRGAFDSFFQTVDTRQEADGSIAMFSRDVPAGGREHQPRGHLSVADVEAEVASWTAKWKNAPRIKVVESIDSPEVPAGVRDERDRRNSQTKGGAPRGVFYDGTVYLIADQLPTAPHAAITLFHEALGHAGLRGVFGDALTPILEQIAALRRAEIKEKAEEYGLDVNSREDRLIAAEEVLAEWAQKRPDIGYVRRAIAAIRQWLRAHMPGFKNLGMTDGEIIANYLLPARGWVERGRAAGPAPAASREAFQPAFSIEQDVGKKALAEFSKADELFALPKSDKDTVAGIAADNDSRIKVGKPVSIAGRVEYTLTMPDQTQATLSVRDPNPWGGEQVYDAFYSDEGMEMVAGRPGENPEDVPPTGDVWIDVSHLKTGDEGAKVYNIAATYAHNTGRIFIGDPHGLSKVALRRRLEHMVSSALKFGTTAHLAPHPDQVRGGHGVPPLRWVYGDDVGNVERMIAASVKALDNAFPQSKLIEYRDGNFYNASNGRVLPRGRLADGLARSIREKRGQDSSDGSTGQAGWRTVARAALFRYLAAAAADSSGRAGTLLDLGSAQRARLQGDGSTGILGSEEERKTRIFYSRAGSDAGLSEAAGLNDPSEFRARAQRLVTDLFNAPGSVSWWHKTVGTMHNLAQRSPQFRRVFDGVQTFIGDVSRYATEAADLAPSLLPKLETWRDIGRSPVSAADTKAIAAPIFEGTLSWARDGDGKLHRTGPADDGAGVVFTDGELRQHFSLTPEQIALYREFRAATDQSLNRLAVTELLRFGGKDVEDLRAMAMDARNAMDAARLLAEHLEQAAIEEPGRAELLRDTAAKMREKAEHVQGLIDRGYAPLSRFGHYTVDVLDESGERAFFGMFETRAEANRMARRMRENYPKGQISHGTVSEQAYKQFSGITPETLELFGEMVGLESGGDGAADQLFQQYLKLAKANRSAMKRLIHRKGIAGFSEDAGRVLAGFVYSNARLTSSNLHTGEISQAVADIPKTEGELKDIAYKLADYVRNPQEEAQAVRGLMFAQYLGGSIASAMVNMTQPVAVTMPYLSQWGGAIKAASRMKGALADVLKRTTGDAALDAALKVAEAEGVVAPQEVHHLMAQARGSSSLRSGDGTVAGDLRAKASNVMSKISLAWGKPFAAAEQFNRRVTFIAAWRTAVAEGIKNPAKFAEEAIRETQFVYNKGGKPQWARGAIGGTLFTFKTYSVSYLELLHRMATQGGPEGKRAAAFALAMLFLMGGAGGLPFMGDAEDVIDGILQRLGYSFSTKQARRQWLIDTLGDGAANFVERGISGLPGVPIDVAGRLGMGNLVPGTGMLTKKTDYGRDVAEIMGPAGDFAQRVFQGTGQVLSGKPIEGVGTMAPTAVRNLQKAVDMYQTGMYRDQRGRKVIDVDGYDALAKAIGFQPTGVAKVQEAIGAQQDLIAQNKMMRTELADAMAVAIFDKDVEKQQEIRERMQSWNRNNPESPVTINMLGVRRRLIAMRASKAERVEKSAPKAIRSDVRRALEEGSV